MLRLEGVSVAYGKHEAVEGALETVLADPQVVLAYLGDDDAAP